MTSSFQDLSCANIGKGKYSFTVTLKAELASQFPGTEVPMEAMEATLPLETSLILPWQSISLLPTSPTYISTSTRQSH